MRTVIRSVFCKAFLIGVSALLVSMGALRTAQAEPPADQKYTGVKRCASCHFDQYTKWKKSKHSKAFDTLTAKYQKDEKCLKCHTTGYGQDTGFTDIETTPALAGNTCEMCHGPGSIHEEVGQKYAKVKKLSPEQEKEVRGSIWKVLPKNICIECHVTQAHKDSQTPAELRPKK